MDAQTFARRLPHVLRYLDYTIKGTIAVSIFAIMAIICLQVFYRFVLGDAKSWPEEASRFLMIWALFIAGAYVFYEGQHSKITYVSSKLPRAVQVAIDIVVNVLIIVLFAIVIYSGLQQMDNVGGMTTGGLGISRAVPYAVLPVSGVLYIALAVYLILTPFLREES